MKNMKTGHAISEALKPWPVFGIRIASPERLEVT